MPFRNLAFPSRKEGVVGAIVGGAAIGAVGSIVGAGEQADAAEAASDAQVQANRENIEFQKWLFEQQKEYQKPWYDVGREAIGQLWADFQSGAYDPGKFNFEADPGYQFRLREGMKAIEGSAAARGGLLSGGAVKAGADYASGLASQEYQNAFNRYLSQEDLKNRRYNQFANIAGIGQTAAGSMQTAGSEMGRQVGASTIASGNAIAQGALAAGQAQAGMWQNLGQTANQAIGNYLLYKSI